jgi:NADH-quinone oxidoreductase subunit D
MELLTGARFSLSFLRYGGVAADVTEGFIERVLEVCELLRIRIKETNDVLTFNEAFMSRTAFVGALPRDLIQSRGMTGPIARASRLPFDVRKAHPYSGYQAIDFEVPLGQGEVGTVGDAHDRFVIRLREIEQSIEILRQAVEEMPSGDFSNGRIGRDFVVPQGEAYSRVESSRGLLGCHVVSDGKKTPSRIQFRVPSLGVVQSIEDFLRGAKVEDFPVILASLDLGVSEVDR